jgi:hypothetical protein
VSTEFVWLAIALVTIGAAARVTRLVTFDVFPPTRWARTAWGDLMDEHDITRPWAVLPFCQWCFSFWATLPIVLWGYFTDFHDPWWIVNGALAGSYLAAIFMSNDGDVSNGGVEVDQAGESD